MRDTSVCPHILVLFAHTWPVAEAFTAIILLDHYMLHLGYQAMWRK